MNKMYHKKIYQLSEFFRAMVCLLNTLPYLKKAKAEKVINKPFIERIMLSVTQVNGCSLCSYQHTKIALKAGMSNSEIKRILAGELDDVPNNEVIGVLFGKHVADQRGLFDQGYLEKLVNEYGKTEAYGILGAVRLIMFTNIMGIAIGLITDTVTLKNKNMKYFVHGIASLMFMIVAFPFALLTSIVLRFINVERLVLGYQK